MSVYHANDDDGEKHGKHAGVSVIAVLSAEYHSPLNYNCTNANSIANLVFVQRRFDGELEINKK